MTNRSICFPGICPLSFMFVIGHWSVISYHLSSSFILACSILGSNELPCAYVGADPRFTVFLRLICAFALAVAAVSAQQASPDRLVAEWALRLGGQVVLEGQN